jgi:hypothetical protein
VKKEKYCGLYALPFLALKPHLQTYGPIILAILFRYYPETRHNKKFWEEPIAYFLCYDRNPTQNDTIWDTLNSK